MVCLWRATLWRQGASSQLRHINVKDGETIDPGFYPNRKPVVEGFDSGTVVAPLGSILVDLIVGVYVPCCAGVVTSPGARRRPCETPDCLSNDKGRRTLHFLPGGRAGRCADPSFAARISLVISDVRAAFRPAFRPLSPGRAGLSRIWPQRLARPESVRLHIRPHRVRHGRLRPGDGTVPLHALYAGLRRPGGLSDGARASGTSRRADRSGRGRAQ
jgi:hypothetical protein